MKYVVYDNILEQYFPCDTKEKMVATVSNCYLSGGTPIIFQEV